MTEAERWDDPTARHGLNRGDVLLNRERRDLLARITKDSVEPFSYFYRDCHRANELEKLLDLEEGLPVKQKWEQICYDDFKWADEILVMSQSGDGWRAKQIENVERGHDPVPTDEGAELDTRGLKHRD